MKHIVITDAVHLHRTISFARANNCLDEFAIRFMQLLETCCMGAWQKTSDAAEETETPGDSVAEIGKDWAPHSFGWAVFRDRTRVVGEPGSCYYAGGLIYEGPGQPHDGSAPAFTVSLDTVVGAREDRPVHRWMIHT